MLVFYHKTAALFVLSLFSCACLVHPASFQVVPDPKSYLLRSPDARETQFPNVLRDYNGFEPGQGWVNLRPGMELRVENAYYQPGASRRGLDGFLGTEVARYAVDENGLHLLTTQPMQNRPAADPPVQDLISPTVAHAHQFRLYFEIVFNQATQSKGSVLVAAASAGNLELTNAEEQCRGPAALCTAFPEACSVSVEMKLLVNGKNETRDWGTLLKSVVGDHPKHLQLRRIYAGRLTPVAINPADQNALKLPLLPGDQIRWD